MSDRACGPPTDEAEIERLTEAGRKRTAAARSAYREQVKAEALHLEAIRIARHADHMGLTGDVKDSHIEHYMSTLSAADIDALTAARMASIMAERARSSALARRRARLDRLRSRLASRGDAA